MTIRTTISTQVLNHYLWQGFLLSLCGVIFLLGGGILLPPLYLKTWGLVLFLIGMGLITFGLLPYRRLSQLQLKPAELIFQDSHSFIYFLNKKAIMTVPVKSVSEFIFIENPYHYGIALKFKKNIDLPVIVHQSPNEVEKMRRSGKKVANADLFLPYFNKRAYNELIEEFSQSSLEDIMQMNQSTNS